MPCAPTKAFGQRIINFWRCLLVSKLNTYFFVLSISRIEYLSMFTQAGASVNQIKHY